jgi:hypothetical protein
MYKNFHSLIHNGKTEKQEYTHQQKYSEISHGIYSHDGISYINESEYYNYKNQCDITETKEQISEDCM